LKTECNFPIKAENKAKMEAELKFEREKRNGIAVVGSYLLDAARRLGVEIKAECGRLGLCDSCAVKIDKGSECLSDLTKAEMEQLSGKRRRNSERLACQTKIIKEGEIVVMTQEKKKEEKPPEEEIAEEFKKEFAALPLEKKIARLVELEAITLGETFAYVLNSPYKIGEKIMEILAQFGLKLEEEAKKAKQPEEHKEKDSTASSGQKTENPKKTPPKRTRRTSPKSPEKKENSQ
jgi:ferredoxin